VFALGAGVNYATDRGVRHGLMVLWLRR
jgi:hypothetical protein